ncbi:Trimeric GatFAB AmidoTransferase(AdT) complex subunit [Scheffersomyces spartinae]|uniref:Trimeric GatFAB AmidoTransferase(AdT) complex subunit n=1 Tax=Scheffersomyces spartinae TaxID=45513 RepID=A0A9P7V8D9_9ASCO|nr:Trimeric GatFAB AmidoTransferase(AdT) complex subunit [Scheffersomyces spartinae]KAG7193188.1 Trimeric GatFAB AmidoTransferase(AdT) complex subunit [Scheffersomyces spartinae]
MVGKTNLDQFGMGSNNTNLVFGPVLNPKYPIEDNPRVAGGSSGGTAAAVALGSADFGIGTDTGGSVRLPATYCGQIGYKPSYGRISRWGVVAYAQSLDTVGIVSKDMAVLRGAYELLDQYDEKDPTSMTIETRRRIKRLSPVSPASTSLTIGIPIECLVTELVPEIKDSWLKLLSQLKQMGHQIRTVSIPHIPKLLLAYYSICTAEASSNLARLDGIRYGHTAGGGAGSSSAPEIMAETRTKGFHIETIRRIILGTYTLSGVSGNHYLRANQKREALVKEFNQIFNMTNPLFHELIKRDDSKCDFLLIPTTITKPPTLEEAMATAKENFLTAYVNDVFTVPASLAGLPALLIPYDNTGFQIIGQYGDDEAVLQFGSTIEHNCI